MDYLKFLDDLLSATIIKGGAILNNNGKVLAISKDLIINSNDISTIIQAFFSPTLLINRICYFNNKKFNYIASDNTYIHGQLEDNFILIERTGLNIIIAVYDQNVELKDADAVVRKLTKSLYNADY
ncbi:Profilin/allergen [Neoconidiobolus thromboides FSU 785]|nr:Profilin/allergen [Neoconidiobolus thromboides FSU 785]